MRQVAGCINKALNERSDHYQQSRKKEHWMHRDTDTDCERDHQSRPRWFENCDQHFFHNASFCRLKHGSARYFVITATWLLLRKYCEVSLHMASAKGLAMSRK